MLEFLTAISLGAGLGGMLGEACEHLFGIENAGSFGTLTGAATGAAAYIYDEAENKDDIEI